MTDQMWQVQASAEGKYWVLTVDGLGGATQAKGVREIDEMVRDFIALTTHQSPEGISYEVTYNLPAEVTKALEKAQTLRDQAAAARSEAAVAASYAAKLLKGQGMTVRDIGAALGVSFQRAQQLVRR